MCVLHLLLRGSIEGSIRRSSLSGDLPDQSAPQLPLWNRRSFTSPLTLAVRSFSRLSTAVDLTRGRGEPIVPHQNRIRILAVCHRCSGWPTQAAERHAAVPLLTTERSCHIVGVDLAIEDIRACEHRGTSGSLASMKVVVEAPAPEAKLITRRSQVPRPAAWAGESWPRYLNEEPRLNEPRFCFHPLTLSQRDLPAITML